MTSSHAKAQFMSLVGHSFLWQEGDHTQVQVESSLEV